MHPVCFYHPLNILFVDDDLNFLNSIELGLFNKIKMLTCTDGFEAIRILSVREKNIDIIRRLDYGDDGFSNQLLNVDINALHSLIEYESRFNSIGIVVVDYHMPGITGIEFLREIKNLSIKKIMLTAEADKDLAIEALNEGLVDKFLFKNDTKLDEKLLTVIQELSLHYFKQGSHIVTESLEHSVKQLLTNEHFKEIFYEVYETANAVEFYLLDKFGSFIFLDKSGLLSCLLVSPRAEQHNNATMVEDLGGSKEMVDSLKAGEKILYLYTDDVRRSPVTEWKNHLYACDMLDSENYYGIVYDCKNIVDSTKIRPYNYSIS